LTTASSKRVTLITGCSSGIGRASAFAFAEAGDRVYASMRDLSKADSLLGEAQQKNIAVIPVELDVTSHDGVEHAVNLIIEKEGALDIVVNNAGIQRAGAFETLSDVQVRGVMETNFFGVLNVTRSVLPHMRKQRAGRILMMSSLSGWAGLAGDSIYAASKFAVEGFTEALRHEVARWGIKLALIEPAGYKTDLMSSRSRVETSRSEPYAAFNSQLGESLSNDAANAGDAAEVARLLVEISRSGSDQFRWPVGGVAETIQSTLFAADDGQRDKVLRSAADIDWWVIGERVKPSN